MKKPLDYALSNYGHKVDEDPLWMDYYKANPKCHIDDKVIDWSAVFMCWCLDSANFKRPYFFSSAAFVPYSSQLINELDTGHIFIMSIDEDSKNNLKASKGCSVGFVIGMHPRGKGYYVLKLNQENTVDLMLVNTMDIFCSTVPAQR
ncbi:hypothetical protein [Winogradskyella sp.]|uniref:hypothetical protein n=1 Tax=Winogradskyella sp. TaxID=1883156 RepID=UPI0026215AC2|nr:hypothetical protein [Winogradskyella sp.]